MGSLFGENSSLHGSSLFGSDSNAQNSVVPDPWANAAPSTASSTHGINTASSSASTLLNGENVPEIYAITFDDAVAKEQETNPSASGHTVSVSALNDLFTQVSLPQSTRTKICSLINVPPYDPNLAPEASHAIDRGTWYVAIALAGFSQKGSSDETLSLSLVDFSRNSLPHISIAKYQSQLRHDDSSLFDRDVSSSFSDSRFASSNSPNTAITSDLSGGGPDAPNGSLAGPVWKSSVDASNYNPLSPNTISVALVPKREGTLFFRHVNYIVEGVLPTAMLNKAAPEGSKTNASSAGTSSFKVIRRYSDFDWLLDALQKKYPFRLLPTLPPKKIAGMITLH